MELTKKQIERQDFVDNAINNLIQNLEISNRVTDWDIELIGNIRDVIQTYFTESNIYREEEFYPYIIE